MPLGPVTAQTEVRLLLSLLEAWKKDSIKGEETPWHITDAGWDAYAHHQNAAVCAAARSHPYYRCPSAHLQQRRLEFKRDVQAFT